MAIKRITDEKDSGKSLPYLNEYIKKLDKKQKKILSENFYGIREVIIPKSGKGLVLTTLEFCAFCWKKSKIEQTIMTLMDDPTQGYPMIEVLDDDGKFNLVLDDEIQYSIEPSKQGFILIPLLMESSNVDTGKEF